MRLFLDAQLSGGFDLASLSFADLLVNVETLTTQSSDGALHFRPTPFDENNPSEPPSSLDGALRLAGFALSAPGLTIPVANIDADITLKEGYQDLVIDRQPLRSVLTDGAGFEIRNLALSLPDGGRLAVAGPIEIDSDGLLSGKISVGVEDPQSVAQWAEQIDPIFSQQLDYLTQAIAGMGKPASFGDHELRSIELTIDRGQPSLGFIQFPEKIPPLFRN